jgi:hypothetical protein
MNPDEEPGRALPTPIRIGALVTIAAHVSVTNIELLASPRSQTIGVEQQKSVE